VARAKRTDRADARRRHRAQLLAEGRLDPGAIDAEGAGDDGSPTATDAARATRSTVTRPRAGAARPGLDPVRPAPAGGIRNAIRQAFRPLNLREDLALLPRLLLHRAFWLPSLLTAVTAALVIAFQGREQISQFAATYFLAPPPIGAIFLAGFMAPRASYLLGALVGVVSSLLLTLTAATVSTLVEGGATPAEVLIPSLSISPLAGIFFGAAAAWYRRFLYLASPVRQPVRRPEPGRGKPARGR
jgi:hypothetical protein